MTNVNGSINMVAPSGKAVLRQQFRRSSGNSTRVNGKLRLRANACNNFNAVCTSYVQVPGSNGAWTADLPGAADRTVLPTPSPYNSSDNMAYSRFWGKVRKGSASMGITLASWKQSREMITSRSRRLAIDLEDGYRYLKRNDKKIRNLRRRAEDKELLANDVLEYKFGWEPLFTDIHAALFTVCKDGIPPEWVTGRGQQAFTNSRKVTSGTVITDYRYQGTVRTTYGARVNISNPNLWLLNRMGLINPATVAWDLVPWSFVVNMFVNCNTMINSVTNEVGLNLTDYSVTRSLLALGEHHKYDTRNGADCKTSVVERVKNRTVGSPLMPTWQVKVPELNWGLATIATSLVVQRFRKINRLLGI